MKRLLLSIFLLSLYSSVFSEVNMNVCITLKLSPLYGGGEIVLYNDTYSRIAETMSKIKNAKKIGINSMVKEALAEGEYIISVSENGMEINSYTVFNSQNIYDKKNDKYLKCDVLFDIYQISIGYFLRDRIKR